jgi:ABC-type phosphate/phosphonate transport system substrate-binding protein
VDHFSFDVMRELNPQVGKDLQAIATSEPFAENVICLSNTGWDSERARTGMIEILADLQSEPAGRQILTLFKVGPMIPFQETQLDTVRQLRAKYEQLRKETRP